MSRLLPLAFTLLLLGGCKTLIPNQNPVGSAFPSVTGTSLTGKSVQIPTDFEGKPAVLMIGYTQRSQFDIDRWILGFLQLETPVRLVEVPTIPGLFPGLFANRIDEGMRRGIPREDWPAVVTVYEEAKDIVDFTGNVLGSNARIMLIDSMGKVRWFSDRGYSGGQIKELDTLIRTIGTK